jgi:hypothetical protein
VNADLNLGVQTTAIFAGADSIHGQALIGFGWMVDKEFYLKTLKGTIIVTTFIRSAKFSVVTTPPESCP